MFISKVPDLKSANINDKEKVLNYITNYLTLNGSFINNPGLLNGKMGIVIFLYHYARIQKKIFYNDLADEILDEIFKEINIATPINFQDGLCGIGWGIIHLIQNGFVNADPDDVLEEIDQRILELNVKYIKDTSLKTGLAGITCYIINRNSWNMPYLVDLLYSMNSQGLTDKHSVSIIEQLRKTINKEKERDSSDPLLQEIVSHIEWDMKTFFEKSHVLGIRDNGLTGIGLQLLWEKKL